MGGHCGTTARRRSAPAPPAPPRPPRRLSPAHRALAPGLPSKAAAARQCAYRNHLFIKGMLGALEPSEDPCMPPMLAAGALAAADDWAVQAQGQVSPADAEKVRHEEAGRSSGGCCWRRQWRWWRYYELVEGWRESGGRESVKGGGC